MRSVLELLSVVRRENGEVKQMWTESKTTLCEVWRRYLMKMRGKDGQE